jgi:hypothetical protein
MSTEPQFTKIDKTIQTPEGEVVLESHSGFPTHESNLYLLASDGEILWKAEKPDPGTLYSRVKLNTNRTLSTYTINGHLCDLDLRTGKILSSSSL